MTKRVLKILDGLEKASVKIKNFPKKPAVNGIPANESIETAKTNAKNGLFFDKPFKASKLSSGFPALEFASETTIKTANAEMVAIEYANE